MAIDPIDRLRYRSMLIAREFKSVFRGVPERLARALIGAFLLGPLLRWLFVAPDGKPHRAGEIVLAAIRRSSGLDRPTVFDPDPVVMAYREGRRSLALEIFNYLNLDEKDVQQLMELDDGLGQ